MSAVVGQVFILYVLITCIRRATGGDTRDTTEEEARPPTQCRKDNEALLRTNLHDRKGTIAEALTPLDSKGGLHLEW